MISMIDVVLSALGAIAFDGPRVSKPMREAARTTAEAQFRAHRLTIPGGATVFDGSVCEVLDASDSFSAPKGGVISDYVLTLFVVMPGNGYFLFKSNPRGKPYVRELAAERAQLVLKDKFRAYTEVA